MVRRMRVHGSRIRKEKVADSKISRYVWPGPKQSRWLFCIDYKMQNKKSFNTAANGRYSLDFEEKKNTPTHTAERVDYE